MNLCKYKNIFGEPNTGAHKKRIFNIAIVDAGMTIIVAVIIYFIIIKFKPHLAETKTQLFVIIKSYIFLHYNLVNSLCFLDCIIFGLGFRVLNV